jgi:hypothetical protein
LIVGLFLRFAPTQEAYEGYKASKPTHAQSANLILNIHKIYDDNVSSKISIIRLMYAVDPI